MPEEPHGQDAQVENADSREDFSHDGELSSGRLVLVLGSTWIGVFMASLGMIGQTTAREVR